MQTPFADRILATTPTPFEQWKFRLLDDNEAGPGDMEVALLHPETKKEVTLRLVIKLSDFGLAQPLSVHEGGGAASHLSVQGFAGTLGYMAPETLQPSLTGRQQLSKRVDVWSLGVMLFQMLHEGKTPFDLYNGNICVALAIANEEVCRGMLKLR